MKRTLAFFLVICTLLALPAAAFSDTDGHWAEEYIALCAEKGLLSGRGDGTFDPDGTLTAAECAACAVRLYALVEDEELPGPAGSGEAWYEPYADFLAGLGVELPRSLDAPCSRALFIEMMAAVVPERMLTPINGIRTLPDTEDESVLAFYNAGILTGMDEYGTFRGELSLTRGECAAMLARIADYTLRVKFRPESGDRSAAMDVLGIPADDTALTIAGTEISAALYTAVLSHELEVIAAEYQLESHPEYTQYYDIWMLGTYAGGFENYLSEIHGINDFIPTDWDSIDGPSGLTRAELALSRTLDWLKYDTALRTLCARYELSLTAEEDEAIALFLEEGRFDGESRILYTTRLLENNLLYAHLCDYLMPSESAVTHAIAAGDGICAEYICFPKHDGDGEPLSDVDIAYRREGALMLAAELQQQPEHFYLEMLTWDYTVPFEGLEPTIWLEDETDPKIWSELERIAPRGASGVIEDDYGIYIYLAINPSSSASIMEVVRESMGADNADREIGGLTAAPAVQYSDAVKYISVAEAAAKAI